MKILVTGATGFLGTAVMQRLAQEGHELRIFRRPSSDVTAVSGLAAGEVVGEITDPLITNRAATGMDAVVHLAAALSHWRRHRERIFRTNVIGTRVMVEAAKTSEVPTFLHVSSIAAVGYSEDGKPITEDAPNNFVPLRLLYHESKRQAEEEALDAVRYGVKVVIVNPGVLYGPRSLQHSFGHTMLDLAAHKVPGHPTGGISIADVDDVAAGIAAALVQGKTGERYLLAGHNVSYEESFKAQAAAVGTDYHGRALPGTLLALAARYFELRARADGPEPRLTIDNAKIAPLRMWYDSAKATRDLNYQIRPLEATLDRMARAYRAAGVLNDGQHGR